MTHSDDESPGGRAAQQSAAQAGDDASATERRVQSTATKPEGSAAADQTMVGIRLGDALLSEDDESAPATPDERTMFGIHVMDMQAPQESASRGPAPPPGEPGADAGAPELATIVGQRLSEVVAPDPIRTRFSIPSPIELPAVGQTGREASRDEVVVTSTNLVPSSDTVVGLSADHPSSDEPVSSGPSPMPTQGWLDDVSSFLKETSGSYSAVGEDERVSRSAEIARRLSDDFPSIALPGPPPNEDPVAEMARRLSAPDLNVERDSDALTNVYDGGETVLLAEDINEVSAQPLPPPASLPQIPPSPAANALNSLVRDIIAPAEDVEVDSPAVAAHHGEEEAGLVVADEPDAESLDGEPTGEGTLPAERRGEDSSAAASAPDEGVDEDSSAATSAPDEGVDEDSSAAASAPDEGVDGGSSAAESAPDEGVDEDFAVVEEPAEQKVSLPQEPPIESDAEDAAAASHPPQESIAGVEQPNAADGLDADAAATALAAAASAVLDEPPAWGILRGYGSRPARRARQTATAGTYAKRKRRRPEVEPKPAELDESELELLEQEPSVAEIAWDHETAPVVALDGLGLPGNEPPLQPSAAAPVETASEGAGASAEPNATIAMHTGVDPVAEDDASTAVGEEGVHPSSTLLGVPNASVGGEDEGLAEWGDEETSTRKTLPSDAVGGQQHPAFMETVASKSVEVHQQRSFLAWAAVGALAGLGIALLIWLVSRAM